MPTADSGCSWVEDMTGDSHPCKAIAKTKWAYDKPHEGTKDLHYFQKIHLSSKFVRFDFK